jgi:AraC family transcriptional regulator of adaptative response/methylated-DNA-[protein]-cysteine methyltransferase
MLLLTGTPSNPVMIPMTSSQISSVVAAPNVLDYGGKLQGVLARDELLDGVFVFAVRSTGIYCNPSCPSRRPSSDLIEFYNTPTDAEQHGFRACKRCKPQENQRPRHSELAKSVCDYVDTNLKKRLTLGTIGSQFGISPFHLHRIFKRVTGMTLHDYVEARRLAVLKRELQRGEPVTKAAYHAGFSSRSRLYNRIQDKLGMQPGTYRRGGKDLAISYTIINSFVGRLLIAATREGICSVCLGESDAFVETALSNEYPAASIQRDDDALRDLASQFNEYFRNRRFERTLPLDLHGTSFQMKVWNQLQSIPAGSIRSYEQIANDLGSPKAVRAVARACASNPAPLVIPCHRVVRKNGELGGYRWGLERKRAILRHERTITQT